MATTQPKSAATALGSTASVPRSEPRHARPSRVKGSLVVGAVKALRAQGAPAREALPEHVRHYLDHRILVSSWYSEDDAMELYVAMARALGLPARVAVGLVYLRGAFYYHAWPEVYVAQSPTLGQWLPVDPTLNQFPADATHVRLARGGLDRQAAIDNSLARLRDLTRAAGR